MIKILTGWSGYGGSTTAHINLCNLFNKNGMDCMMYGPQNWHLNQTKGDLLGNVKFEDSDTLIFHYIQYPVRPPCKKFIYSCHETNIQPISSINYQLYDSIHYVSNSQRLWHNIEHPAIVIPNVLDDLKPNPKNNIYQYTIAGVIGSIDAHKQTHLSIQRAIDCGYKMIVLCGNIPDPIYYRERIDPLIKKYPGIIFTLNYIKDKQKMYDNIQEVFHSSLRETYGLVQMECLLTNTKFNGLDSCRTDAAIWSNEAIIEAWKSIL